LHQSCRSLLQFAAMRFLRPSPLHFACIVAFWTVALLALVEGCVRLLF
jgi:hypothetical protein